MFYGILKDCRTPICIPQHLEQWGRQFAELLADEDSCLSPDCQTNALWICLAQRRKDKFGNTENLFGIEFGCETNMIVKQYVSHIIETSYFLRKQWMFFKQRRLFDVNHHSHPCFVTSLPFRSRWRLQQRHGAGHDAVEPPCSSSKTAATRRPGQGSHGSWRVICSWGYPHLWKPPY